MLSSRLQSLVLFASLLALVPVAGYHGWEFESAVSFQDARPRLSPDSTPSQPVPGVPDPAPRPLAFLLDSSKHPRIAISWPRSDASAIKLDARREYAAPKQATPLGLNLSAYVALGGNRGDLGLGTPGTVDVRVGFYSIDPTKPMFDRIAPNSVVTIEFSGITFNQPAAARPLATLQHLTFQGNDRVLGCAADPGLLATYNTMDPSETLRDRMTKRNGRPGVLAGTSASDAPHARIEFSTDQAGSVSMKATIPYHLFKHADDPWLTSNPGDFVEPMHFHIEFECAPIRTPLNEQPTNPSPPKPIPAPED